MRRTLLRKVCLITGSLVALGLGACSDDTTPITPTFDSPMAKTFDAPPSTSPDAGSAGIDAGPAAPDASASAVTAALMSKVDTVVVIFAENRGFDNMYGKFPGANGIPGVSTDSAVKGTVAQQVDRDGTTAFATLPAVLPSSPSNSGIFAVVPAGKTQVPFTGTGGTPNGAMFSMEDKYNVDIEDINEDLWHRFFQNQMQIANENKNFVAWADTGSLVMGYFDGSRMALWEIAKENVLADNFFQGAFGGSFLNHQYLACACAPEWAGADADPQHPVISILNKDANNKFTPFMTVTMPSSVNDGVVPKFMADGAISPLNYFGDNKFYGINTLQPPWQPSFGAPDATASPVNSTAVRTVAGGNVVPPQDHATIGDQLDTASVKWAWYAGAYRTTLAARMANSNTAGGNGVYPNFQMHHHPFNYVTKANPTTVDGQAYRAAHLKDEEDLLVAATSGKLENVVFWKPAGYYNQHSGYASILDGDQHIADMVATLQRSPQYGKMVIVITYDENGGFYDHVVPPKGDLLGPGTRIPAIIISPLAKHGTVDHTQYDTASILRLIERRWGLPALPGITQRDTALTTAGGTAMGDLTSSLSLF